MLRVSLATGLAVLMSTSVADAQTFDENHAEILPAIVYAAIRLPDERLASVCGMGLSPLPNLQQSARDDFEGSTVSRRRRCRSPSKLI